MTLTQEQRDIMAALAEEHNYFALSPSKERKVDATVDPHVLRIAEEYSYRWNYNNIYHGYGQPWKCHKTEKMY